MKESSQGTIALLIACFFWGCTPTISKLGIETIPPLYFIGFSFLVGGIVLSIIFIKKLKFINKRIVLFSFVTSIFLSAASILEIYGLKYISPIKSGLLISFETIFIPIICFFLFKAILGLNDLISIVLAFLGLILINHNGISFDINIGVFLTIFSAIFFAVQAIIISRIVKKQIPILIAIVELLLSSVICLFFAIFTEGTLSGISQTSLFAVLFSGIFCSGVAFSLQALGQKYISVFQAGIINSTIPIFSIFIARIILGDSLSNIAILGSILIIISIINENINGTKLFKHNIKQKKNELEIVNN